MIHVVARSHLAKKRMVDRHPHLENSLQFHEGIECYFSLINKIIESDSEFACIVHDDIYLPRNFMSNLEELINELKSEWPKWGLAGNAGVLPFPFGKGGETVVRYLSDPHGGPNFQGTILPASSIDGNVMLLNCRSMRENSVRVPALRGFQLYDLILSLMTISHGLCVLVAPQLSCYHESGGNQDSFNSFASSLVAQDALSGISKNRMFQSLNGTVEGGYSPFVLVDKRIDLEIEPLRVSAQGKRRRKLSIIVRSQFKDMGLLRRSIETANAFIASVGGTIEAMVTIVTDRKPDVDVANLRASIHVFDDLKFEDTRNHLIEKTLKDIPSDWYWFVDDDDWIFPNEAERLALVISTIPADGVIFIGTQHFIENPCPQGHEFFGPDYEIKEDRYFTPLAWAKSASGHNHIPFPGMIVSKESLIDIDTSIFTDVVYFEDYALQLSAARNASFVAVIDKLYVGISIRPSGNTVTEIDRSKWNASMSELCAKISNDKRRKYLVHR